MKQIIKNSIVVVLFGAVYLAVRYFLFSSPPNVGWDTASILLATVSICFFVVYHSALPERSVFASVFLFFFFVSGTLFWLPVGVAQYAIWGGTVVFLLLSAYLLYTTIKSVKKGDSKLADKPGKVFLIAGLYLLIVPIVAAGEMFF